MEREEEKPKAFKVDDRRRFSAEGDLKPEFRGSEETAAPPQPPPEPPPATSAESAQAAEAYADRRTQEAAHDAGATHHPADQSHAQHAPSDAAAEITFGTFLVGLSTQALMQLGDIPDPQTGKPEQDLVGAQQLIDIIGMLELKTRGNLDRDEEQLIEAVLYELRMKYVERARLAR
jgi:Domain of unknown function (DUF1844)